MIMNEEAITSTGSTEERREGAAATDDDAATAAKSLPIKFKSKKTKSFVNKNATNPNTTDYKSLTHEQLVIEATRLQQHVTQLKNLLTKANAANDELSNKKKKVFKERPFNFDNYNKRHVLLRFLYLGWNYKVFFPYFDRCFFGFSQICLISGIHHSRGNTKHCGEYAFRGVQTNQAHTVEGDLQLPPMRPH